MNQLPLRDHYCASPPAISFELFPPKSEDQFDSLYATVNDLNAFHPAYFTCTYGAGGSTRDRTLQVASGVKKRIGVPVASHLTCVGSTVEQLRNYLANAKEQQIDYIVALRGDPPKGQTEFQMTEGGFRHANQLVRFIRDEFPEFGIAVAGYPEVHQEAPNLQVDIENLKRKVDSGADIVITQLFYNNADFFRFRDLCERADIRIPIIPGILPVTNLAQIQRITSLCKAVLPESFVDQLAESDDPQWQLDVGVAFATEQVRELIEQDAPGVHFYVLNRSTATVRILSNLKSLLQTVS